MRLPRVASVLLILINKALSLNILVILPYNGKNHFTQYEVYIKELANKGHNVTVISHFPEQNPPRNYKDISLAGRSDINASSNTPRLNILEFSNYNLFLRSFVVLSTGINDCEAMLANEEVRSLIKSKQKFDVAVVEQFNSDCALGVAYKTGAPVVGIFSDVVMPYHYQRFGIPDNPSYVSFRFLGGGTKPTFFQRLERVFFRFYLNNLHYYYSQRMNHKILEKYFDDIPPLEDLGREIKFLLMCSQFVLTGSKLLPANVIEVGGYHVKEPKPLTGELRKFVDKAEHGVVYISFGSVLNSSSLPHEKVQAFVETMKEFSQRFIWKWESDGLDMKSKLYTSSWLPQTDILGHPKTLAFISHGGMGGTTEALHFGVPMIVTPFFGDQPSNAAAIEKSGFGIQLQYKDLTKENLVAALKKVLDPDLRKRSEEVSRAWRDRPMSPLDTAVFWTEFAARHPNFTFRTAAADVPLYQYLYLDVITTILLMIGVFGFILKSCCCKTKQRTKLQEKKNKLKRA